MGHVLSIEHKNHGPGVLGALKLGGQATAQPKESRIEGDNSMSVSVPIDYHTGITRVFVPWVQPTQIHQARESPAPLRARATSHTSGYMHMHMTCTCACSKNVHVHVHVHVCASQVL